MAEITMSDINEMLRDSDELNKVRQKIHRVLIIVLSFIKQHDIKLLKRDVTFSTHGLQWTITRGMSSDLVFVVLHDNPVDVSFRSDGGIKHDVKMEKLPLVYEALPRVITEIARTFPSAQSRLAEVREIAHLCRNAVEFTN